MNERVVLSIKDIAFVKQLSKEDIDDYLKSYSHKPHLASLPYDHGRGRTMEQLVERYNEINDRMKELRSDRNKLIDEHRKDLPKYKEIWRERDNLIDKLDKMKDNDDYDEKEFNNLKKRIDSMQKEMDEYKEKFKSYKKNIKRWDMIAHDYLEDQRKIKWTAFKNGLLNDTMSPEDIARAEQYIKEHGL